MTDASRSEQNAKNATRHGYFSRDKRATTEHCFTMLGRWYRTQEFEICSEWLNDDNRFGVVDDVLSEIGKRPLHLMLAPHDTSKPVGPGNIEWVPRPPDKLSFKKRLYRARRGIVEQDCVCDQRGRDACAAGNPCSWLLSQYSDDLFVPAPERVVPGSGVQCCRSE